MRALWLVRRDLEERRGGDTTQVQQTAAALRRRGVEVGLAHDCPADLSRYDLVHLFHLDRLWENIEHARRARAAGRPIALSTIYWPGDEYDRLGRTGVQGVVSRLAGSAAYQNLRLLQRYLLHCFEQGRVPRLRAAPLGFRRHVLELLATAAVLLPNSQAEREQIELRFGVIRPTVVVPNAADPGVFRPPEVGSPRSGVLCVGRIEPRKNQLRLIEALRGTEIPLTLVGSPGRLSRAYYRRCRRLAGANVRFVPAQPAEELGRLYQAACVHACVSWYETPGLASLEAALCGCALVVTPGGCTREYFGDQAVYAEPDDPTSIRVAIECALRSGPHPQLRARVAREYNWERAADKTVQAYQLALALS